MGRAEPRELVLAREATSWPVALGARSARLAQPAANRAVAGGRPPRPSSRAREGWLRSAACPTHADGGRGRGPGPGYARATQPTAPLPRSALELFSRSDTLIIDEQARAHLELTETLLDRRRTGSLLRCSTKPARRWAGACCGAGCCSRWSRWRPSAAVTTRSSGWSQRTRRATPPATILADVADIERLVGRARLGVASPRDLVALGRSLAQLPALRRRARRRRDRGRARRRDRRGRTSAASARARDPATDDLGADLAARSRRPARRRARVTKEGGSHSRACRASSTSYRRSPTGGRGRLAAIEARERERTGIASLKIKFNSVFGYYIEVTRAQLARVPADYVASRPSPTRSAS